MPLVSRAFLATEVAYPYTGTDTTGCRAGRVGTAGAVTLARPSYQVVPGTAEAIMAAVYRRGVAVVYWNVDESFVGYTSGIYPASACKADGINHAMAIVGYSRAERYWIVRNSWGSDWGEGGYARVEMAMGGGPGTCGMQLWGAIVPLATERYSPVAPLRPPPAQPPPKRQSPPPRQGQPRV